MPEKTPIQACEDIAKILQINAPDIFDNEQNKPTVNLTAKQVSPGVFSEGYEATIYTPKVVSMGNDGKLGKTHHGSSDENTYNSYPQLKNLIPRGYSVLIVTKTGEADNQTDEKNTDNFVFRAILQGFYKFGGETKMDVDESSDQKAGVKMTKKLIDEETKYAKESLEKISKCCKVLITEKSNGKNAVMTMFDFNGETYLFGGSKANHKVLKLRDLPGYLEKVKEEKSEEEKINVKENEIKEKKEKIKGLKEKKPELQQVAKKQKLSKEDRGQLKENIQKNDKELKDLENQKNEMRANLTKYSVFDTELVYDIFRLFYEPFKRWNEDEKKEFINQLVHQKCQAYDGYTATGELEDGTHIVLLPGEKRLALFGLVRNSGSNPTSDLCVEVEKSIAFFKKFGFAVITKQAVGLETIKQHDFFKNVMKEGLRMGEGTEGYVFHYQENTIEGYTTSHIEKFKTYWYVILRMARETIKYFNNPKKTKYYKTLSELLQKKLVEKNKTYLKMPKTLFTAWDARLQIFGKWIEGNKEQMEAVDYESGVGFAAVWQKFEKYETDEEVKRKEKDGELVKESKEEEEVNPSSTHFVLVY